MMQRARGFTLVELLVAMVIAAILMAIAVPSYRSYVQRTQRTEARQALTQARAAQERYFLQYNRYAADVAAVPPGGLGLPGITANGLYALQVTLTPTGYSLRATPVPGGAQQDDTRCAAFTVDESGRRTAIRDTGEDNTEECWR
jgi:type IV pilus assembly protein PilE